MAYICCVVMGAQAGQTVVETTSFRNKAKSLLSADEVAEIITLVANQPEAGNLIKGTGGVRKVRIPRKGQGKSGGFRVVYFFHNPSLPIFLLTVFGKNELQKLTTMLVATYGVK